MALSLLLLENKLQAEHDNTKSQHQRWGGCCKFKRSLIYVTSFRTVMAAQWDLVTEQTKKISNILISLQ